MTTPKHPAGLQLNTLLAHAGRKDKSQGGPVNPPVIRASTILFPDTDALHDSHGKRHAYGRHGTETSHALEQALCAAEGAADCLLTPSGLSAITTTLLALLRPGEHLLMVDSCYAPTRQFCDGYLKQAGISTTYYDPLIGAGISSLLQDNTKVVFVESPGSLTFDVQDIPAIAQASHARGAVVVSDSTWATPIGWSSFALGIDVSLHAATKYIVGHSDVLMGAILCTEVLSEPLRFMYRQLGLNIGSDDAALALRGLRTLAARLNVHKTNAQAVAQWLLVQPEVAQLLYPPMAGSPGHELWKRDFRSDYACGLMGVEFHANITQEQVNAIVNRTRLFGIGFSWGGYESLILPIQPYRSIQSNQWKHPMMRLHIGLEAANDLIDDLTAGFNAMRELAK